MAEVMNDKLDPYPSGFSIDQLTVEGILIEAESGVYDDEEIDEMIVKEGSDPSLVGLDQELISLLAIKTTDKNKEMRLCDKIMLEERLTDVVMTPESQNFGKPTCVTVGNNGVLALGTSYGTILIFGPPSESRLQLVLGRKGFASQLGSVSALDFTPPSSNDKQGGALLLVGHARGPIALWELNSGKCLQLCHNVCNDGYSVLQAKFSISSQEALILDSKGVLLSLKFKNIMGVRSYECLSLIEDTPVKNLNENPNEILNFCPLRFSTVKESFLAKIGLVAFCSRNNMFVAVLRPEARIISRTQLLGDQQLLPLISWKPENDDMNEIVVAGGRERNIKMIRIYLDHQKRLVRAKETTIFKLSHEISTMNWLSMDCLAVLDPGETLHLLDVTLRQEIQSLNMRDIFLIYGSQFFKSYESGGKVRPVMEAASRHACFNSVCTSWRNGKLFIYYLGTRTLMTVSLPTWKERVDILLHEYKLVEALLLCCALLAGKAGGVLQLAKDPIKRREQLRYTTTNLIITYVDLSLSDCQNYGNDGTPDDPDDEDSVSLSNEKLKAIARISIECCVAIEEHNILFGEVYEKFSQMGRATTFIFYQALAPFILEDKVTIIEPTFTMDLIENYVRQGYADNLEPIVTHLDPSGIDFEQLIQVGAKNALYGVLIYAYTCGLRDYTSPLRILIEHLYLQMLPSLNEKGICELSHRNEKMAYKLLVFLNGCLTGRAYPKGNIQPDMVQPVKQMTFSLLLSESGSKSLVKAEPYPYIRVFLLFNAKDFLNVLSIALDEGLEEGLNIPGSTQQLINILLEVCFQDTELTTTPQQLNAFFTFLARQRAKHATFIQLDSEVYEKIIQSLRDSKIISHSEKEQAIIELMDSGAISEQYTENKLLVWALEGRFYQVCEKIYTARKQYAEVLKCYWNEPARAPLAFRLIHTALSGTNLTEGEKEDVENEAVRRIKVLVHISARESAELVLTDFPDRLDEIINKQLKSESKLLYEFLDNVLKSAKNESIQRQDNFTISFELQEVYIELLAKFNPDNVLEHIKTTEQYRLDEVLKICTDFKLNAASAFLYERKNNYEQAFSLLTEAMKTSFKLEHSEKVLTSKLNGIIGLLERASAHIEHQFRQGYWFELLDILAVAKIDKAILQELVKKLLNCMNGQVNLTSLFQKITQPEFNQTDLIEDIQSLMISMLKSCSYQQKSVSTVNNIILKDLHTSFDHWRRESKKAIYPRSNYCSLCNNSFTFNTSMNIDNSNADVILFKCNHLFHLGCQQEWLMRGEGDFCLPSCPVCYSGSKTLPYIAGVTPIEKLKKDSNKIKLSSEQRASFSAIKCILYPNIAEINPASL